MPLELNIPFTRVRRTVYFGLVGLTTLGGTLMMAAIVSAQGLTLLECLILALFVPTFACIVVPFWTSVIGFVLRVSGRDPVTLGMTGSLKRPLPGEQVRPRAIPKTALVIPVHNEQPEFCLLYTSPSPRD